jgi:hypothetical protein
MNRSVLDILIREIDLKGIENKLKGTLEGVKI